MSESPSDSTTVAQGIAATPTLTKLNKVADTAANTGAGIISAVAKTIVDVANAQATQVNKIKKLFGFAEGGLVDFTGPVMVHRSTAKPEAFLSARDTENIRSMLDAFNYVRVASPFVPSASMLSSNNTQVGDINITINQAELKDDADFDEVARRVGQAFTKELSKQGLNLSRYAM